MVEEIVSVFNRSCMNILDSVSPVSCKYEDKANGLIYTLIYPESRMSYVNISCFMRVHAAFSWLLMESPFSACRATKLDS